MINPLSIATRGRIANTAKRTLTLATIGWMLTTSTPPTPPNPVTPDIAQGGSYTSEKTKLDKRRNFVLRDDDEILSIIKMFLECQK
jgi:hypothetical protein